MASERLVAFPIEEKDVLVRPVYADCIDIVQNMEYKTIVRMMVGGARSLRQYFELRWNVEGSFDLCPGSLVCCIEENVCEVVSYYDTLFESH